MSGSGALTTVQLVIVAFILAYAWSVRKMNRAAITVAMAAIALLHVYDHLYRIKRGEERLFFLPGNRTEYFGVQTEKNSFTSHTKKADSDDKLKKFKSISKKAFGDK